jgi:hypothetical protein
MCDGGQEPSLRLTPSVKSKERPNRSEGKIQNECGEEGKKGYFVEVFLIVS